MKNRTFSWTSGINLTLIKNNISALSYEGERIYGSTSGLEQTNVTLKDNSVGSLFVVRTVGVNPANGQRIFLDKDGKQVQYNHVVPTGQSRWTYVSDGSAAPAITVLKDGVIMSCQLPSGRTCSRFQISRTDAPFTLSASIEVVLRFCATTTKSPPSLNSTR